MLTRDLLTVLAAVTLATPAVASTAYVDRNAAGPVHDGSSWCSAYLNVQDALAGAAPGATIRVADGTYRPDQGSGQTPGDRVATFQLKSGVALEGGYAGCGAPEPDARDVEIYDAILSGNLGGSNSYQVVTGSGTDANAVIDGFTITGGAAFGAATSGAGMFNVAGHPTVRNCTIGGNTAQLSGAGMYNTNSSPTISNCTFIGNSVPSGNGGGGGMLNSNSHPIITDCRFIGNAGPPSSCGANCLSGWGGGMQNFNNSHPTLLNCAFRENTTGGGGGAMFNSSSWPTVVNCTFDENEALSGLGGAMYNTKSGPTIRACTFSRNRAPWGGGAISNLYSNPSVSDCTFVANVVPDSVSIDPGGAMYNSNSAPIVTNCTFAFNDSDVGGGIFSIFSPNGPIVTNCIFWGNAPPQVKDSTGIAQSTTVINWTIIQGGWTGAGGIGILNADPLFVDADGPDNIPGTPDDNLRLMPDSPAIDSGDPAFISQPGVTDLDGKPRVLCGRVDRGAYESGVVGDFDCDQALTLADFGDWPECETGPVDPTDLGICAAFDSHTDGDIDLRDFAHWQLAIEP